ncbi:hypothetical protein TCA2_2230 [Paenibacillus sp. TCA20]|nr:hypothetical protein TCA2_2230 [Paenibacillus sp. TCA20]
MMTSRMKRTRIAPMEDQPLYPPQYPDLDTSLMLLSSLALRYEIVYEYLD